MSERFDLYVLKCPLCDHVWHARLDRTQSKRVCVRCGNEWTSKRKPQESTRRALLKWQEGSK